MLEDAIHALRKGRPGHGPDLVLRHNLPQLPLLAEGVQLDLVHRRDDLMAENQVAEPVGQEVAHPDGPDLPAQSSSSMVRQLPW